MSVAPPVQANALAALLPGVWSMAISVEPAGGSPTGAPTGPVILSGPCVKLIYVP
jgi:anti-sigma-K factor RskA